MIFKRKKTYKKSFSELLISDPSAFPVDTKEKSLQFLIRFFNEIRPQGRIRQNPEIRLREMILLMENNPAVVIKLQQAILSQLVNTNLEKAFTESGIPPGGGFFNELFGRLKHKILPEEKDENDFLYILQRIFYKKNDFLWVQSIKRSIWISFFELLQFTIRKKDRELVNHLLDALMVLSFQIANDGLSHEVEDYTTTFNSAQNNPFLIQSFLVYELRKHLEEATEDDDDNTQIAAKLKNALLAIEQEIRNITETQNEKGTSLRQSYLLLLLSTRVERMHLLLSMVDSSESFDMGNFVDLFMLLVRNENQKNSIRTFISDAVGYIAYQIAEHKGARGNKYITSTRKEYNHLFLSSLLGGLVICFVTVIKSLLMRLHYAYFWQGFWYSINYSLGFIVIDQSGATLTTKQPAFTANAVASSFDIRKTSNSPNLLSLAVTIAKVIRGQMVSFIGNLMVVIPGTYFLAWAYHQVMGEKLVSGGAALSLLKSIHPAQSLSLLYACNTGVCLFLSGIIAGYIQNKVRFSNIENRLVKKNQANATGKKIKYRLARYFVKYAGSYAGNISLGFFLGMSIVIAKIFSLPLDTNHVTISSGNLAIGVYGLGIEHIPRHYLLVLFLGVIGIGFLNFFVSFFLAFFVAVKSRGIHFRQYPELIRTVVRYFFRKPLSFIFPPKKAI